MAAITIDGLTKRFGQVIAVDDLSFEVDQGTVVGFLGPNGAGKTTTLRMLLGLVTPTSGTARIDGRPYRELADPIRHVGAVLEASSFHPGRSARNHLRVIATAAGLPLVRADEVLAQVGLAEAARRRVGGFSLGMRQRLGLATALLGDPQVLILDEPANGLDPEGVHWLRGLPAPAGRPGPHRAGLQPRPGRGRPDRRPGGDHRLRAAGHPVHPGRPDRPHRPAGAGPHPPGRDPARSLLAAQGIQAELDGADQLLAAGTTTETVGKAAAAAGIVIYEMGAERSNLEDVFLQLTSPQGA